jgi:hypothetical protein
MWGSRRRRRPRLRWLEDVEKDIGKMKVKRGEKRQSIGKEGLPLCRRPRLSEGRRAKE